MTYTFHIGATPKATSLEVTPKYFDTTKSSYYSDPTDTGTLRDAIGGNNNYAITAINFFTAPNTINVSYGIGKFVSAPINSPTLSSGAITPSISIRSSLATSETFDVYMSAYVTVGSTDAIRGTILPATSYVNWFTCSIANNVYTVTSSLLTGSAVTMVAGDRIVIEIAIRRVTTGNSSWSTLSLENANFVMNGLNFSSMTSEIKTIYQTIEGSNGASVDPYAKAPNPFSYISTPYPILTSLPTPIAPGSTVAMKANGVDTPQIGFTSSNWSTNTNNGHSGFFFFQILSSSNPSESGSLLLFGNGYNANFHFQSMGGGQYQLRTISGFFPSIVNGSGLLSENTWYRFEWSYDGSGSIMGYIYSGTSNTNVASVSTTAGSGTSNAPIFCYVRMQGASGYPHFLIDQFVVRNQKTNAFPFYGTTNFPATASTVIDKNGTLLYNTYATVADSASLVSNTLKVAAKDGTVLYDIPVLVSTSAILSYNDMVVVTRPQTVIFNDYETADANGNIQYNSLQSIDLEENLRYDILGLVDTQTALLYNVLFDVMKDFVIVYDVEQSLVKIWTGSEWINSDLFKIWNGFEWVGFDQLSVYQNGQWIPNRI